MLDLDASMDLSDVISEGPSKDIPPQPKVAALPATPPPATRPRESKLDFLKGVISVEDEGGVQRTKALSECTGAEFLKWAVSAFPIEDPGPPERYDNPAFRYKAYLSILTARSRQFGYGKEMHRRTLWN